MTLPLDHWSITQDAANDEVYATLMQDRVWNCFALADLEPPLREYSQFAVASHNKSNESAICLILRHPIIGQVISPFGNKEGIVALLKQLHLPEHPLIQAQEIHLSALQHYYRRETAWRGMLRMAIAPGSLQSPRFAPHRPVKQLMMSDLPALKNLYAQHPEGAFSANLFTQGMYFGIYEGERIIAAGGTHALVPTHGIAVLGNILTAPEARGQGYATTVTATLVTMLFKQRFFLIVLNVFEDNGNAIRIYERLGFQTHHRLLTGKAILIQ